MDWHILIMKKVSIYIIIKIIYTLFNLYTIQENIIKLFYANY